ncbi:Polyketide synthase [Mycena sanguinolenta]|uniref:Polyketide synthase n=1 Tax=Mycena sanguinolenta TaxID=230812 RepID=A0A8H6X419_9AGAR|nr:Polyketide synthase [Mycena sanguinolenta]
MPFTARRLLELSFEALADSGIDYRGKQIGCFMSGAVTFEVSGAVDTGGSFASIPSALANRISYMLDITGPSLQLDTACSSSLTGLHLAIRAIEAGDCAAALVGGAQINRELAEWKNYGLSGVLSSDGITKPFDAGADGFGRGEGAVVVVLKPLEDALRDNDHVYAVVLGSAINSTGSGMPLNVPNAIAQKECIRSAYARAGKKPIDADFAELHITGTSVGDPIEGNAAGEIFAREDFLDVGTVKGNVGHLEAAAFLVSLLKACLMFEKGLIPPNRIGGSTGHVVLEAPPTKFVSAVVNFGDITPTFVVGGMSPKAVAHICQSICDANLSSVEIMRACAVTLARRARQLPWRTYFTLPISPGTEIMPATLVPPSAPPLAFVFSGQGPQNLDMGRGLFATFPVFRSTILELDGVYRRVMGESLLETTGLFIPLASTPSLPLAPTGWPVTITVAAIAMVQIALFDLLLSVGISPTFLVGHSAGETAIIYASGAGSKAMALEIAIARGQAMTVTESPDLGMASLACSADVAVKIIAQISSTNNQLEISCYNSPDSVALSGSGELLEAAITLARSQGIFAQRIRTMVPGHSTFMDQIQDDYMARMAEIFARHPGPHIPRIPVFSTCIGQVLVDEFTPSYFWANCRNPVAFSPAIFSLLKSRSDASQPAFLEISCHPVLSFTISQHDVPQKSVLCPMRRRSTGTDVHEQTVFTETLAQITLLGYNACDLSALYGVSEYKPSFIDHPLISRPIPQPKTHFSDAPRSTHVNGPLALNAPMTELTHPLLAQHVINGEPILPATGFIEILLENGVHALWDVEFRSFFSLSARNSAYMILERSECSWSLKSIDPTISSSTAREHAHGLLDTSRPGVSPEPVHLQAIWDRLPKLEMEEGFYRSLACVANFGPVYQKVARCHGSPLEVIAEIQSPSLDESSDQYVLHPATLDACLHILLHPALSKHHGNPVMYLPSKLGHFAYYNPKPVAGNWFSYIKRRAWYPGAKLYNIVITQSSGAVICEFRDLLVRRVAVEPPAISRSLDLIFQPVAVSAPASSSQAEYSRIDHNSDEETLFQILDSLALRMISKSLMQDIVVGDTLSRQRYFEFAKRALRSRKTDEVLCDSEEMYAKYPAHFEVTARIADIHETVFHSSSKAVETLYSDDLMTRFYSRDSQTSMVYPEVAKQFSSLLDSLQQSGKRAISILEVGAGTGLLTRYLIEELQRKTDLLAEYTVSDASYGLAAELARNIPYNKMTPKIYDVSRDALGQGFDPESYDVIVALHVLHVVPDIRSCLKSLQRLLVPGGSLVVIDFDGTSWEDKVGSVWFDCVFGSFSEWFEFADERTHCTMPSALWLEMLKDVGFTNNHAIGDGGHNFFFTAQKTTTSDEPSISNSVEIDSHCVLHYSFGTEMELRSRISTMRAMDSLDLYVVALEGRDGDSAMGLCATLRREFPFWNINLAIFESTTHLSDARHFLSSHRDLYQNGEQVVVFRHDGPCVSRVALLPALDTIPQDYSIALDDVDHLLVEIIAVGTPSPPGQGFVGRVVMTHLEAPSPGSIVVGIADHVDGPVLVAHIGSLVPFCTERVHDNNHLPDPRGLINLVAPILVFDRLPKRIGPPGSRIKVLIATVDEPMSQILSQYLGGFESVALVDGDFRDGIPLRHVDVVISDSLTSTRYPGMRNLVSRPGRLLLWDSIIRDNLRDGTWEIAYALNSCLSRVASVAMDTLEAPTGHLQPPLFLHDKSYILLGGIGGLGVDLAVWMYERGARHIVLTSRRGIASLDPQTDDETLCKLAYLQSCRDLELILQTCDATNACATSLLLNSLRFPIAGCFQLTLVLSDGLFSKQTHDDFCAAYDSKVKVFEVFANEVDITSLDFYVAFSSFTGLLGLAGQSNYGSACTALEGTLARYDNTFSLVVPGILDAGYLERTSKNSVAPELMIPVARRSYCTLFQLDLRKFPDLWACLQDGLQRLRDGSRPFTRYIPDLDWAALHSRDPLPRSFHHLLSSRSHAPVEETRTTTDMQEETLQILLSFVEVQKEDFDFERPLLSYGLDSLSATRLSAALQPHIQVSQIQLLAGISWSELRTGLAARGPAPGADSVAQLAGTDLAVTEMSVDLSRSAMENIVEICPGSGTPLILFPGGDGQLAPLLALRSIFPGALWGIQVTDKAPMDSLPMLAAFWVEQIRQRQPNGPYRLAAFSASSVVSVVVAKSLEDQGQTVLQLTFIDHFPLVWAHETTAPLLREQKLAALADKAMTYMIELLRRDPVHADRTEQITQLEAAWARSPQAKEPYMSTAAITRRLAASLLQFLVDTFYSEPSGKFMHWVSSVKAPLSVLIAESGMKTMLPDTEGGFWEDLGAHLCTTQVEIHVLEGVGHFGILADERTVAFLQRYDMK